MHLRIKEEETFILPYGMSKLNILSFNLQNEENKNVLIKVKVNNNIKDYRIDLSNEELGIDILIDQIFPMSTETIKSIKANKGYITIKGDIILEYKNIGGCIWKES